MDLAQAKILILEDAIEYQVLIKKSLGDSPTHDYAADLEQARRFVEKNEYDMMLFDVMLPDGNGFQYFVEVKAMERFKDTPIIFLTAKGETSDKVMGLSLGASDYMVKPFDLVELRARVLNKLKFGRPQTANSLNFESLHLDLANYRVERVIGEEREQIDLSPLEVKLFGYFIRNKESVMSRDQILAAVWGDQVHVLDRTVDSAVAGLRKKLGPDSAYIKSIHGVGYMLTREGVAPQRASG